MNASSSATSLATAWSLTDLVASDARGRLDLAKPAAGLTVTGVDRLLGLDLRSTAAAVRLTDHWARGDDLVGVYEPADPRRLRTMAMWRSLPASNAWELVVSAQTALVESDSSMAVVCDLAAGPIAWGHDTETGVCWQPLAAATCPPEATCLLVRRDTDAVLIAVHPADVRRIVVARAGPRLHVACWLFSAAIEKGVLLRSRVLAAVGPTASTGWAEAAVRAFAASPPPLTT